MNYTKTLAIVAVLTTAVGVGIFGAQLVQPAHAEQCAAAAGSVTGSASAATSVSSNKEKQADCAAEAEPPTK
jgi:hypothetical protein